MHSQPPLQWSGDRKSSAGEVTQWARNLLKGDLACWYEVRHGSAGWVITGGHIHADPGVESAWRTEVGLLSSSRDLSPDLPPAREMNRILDVKSTIGPVGGARYETYLRTYARFGFADHRRTLLYDGRRFLGWFGVVRAADNRPYTRADTRAMARALPTIRAAYRAHSAGLELDARGANTCVVSGAGTIEYHTPNLQVWLTADRRRRMGEAVRRRAQPEEVVVVHVDRCEASITPLHGQGDRRYLLTLAPTNPAFLDLRYDLSPRQREVATLSAAGASATEVATMLGLSPHTIRDHMKVVYSVLGVASRAELGSAWGALEDKGMLDQG